MTDLPSGLLLRIRTASLTLITLTATSALAVYGYLGFYSRHMADDYCIANIIRGNFFINLWHNYLTVSDRFANFIFIAVSESVWPRGVSVLPAFMLIVWVIGIAWLLREAGSLAGTAWPASIIAVISVLAVFFAILQAPNRYQTLYWRASIAAHLVPLACMPYLAAFILRNVRSSEYSRPSMWLYPLLFISSFIMGDFSEPTDAIMIVLLGCAMLALWLWYKGPRRRSALFLLGWTMFGALTALLVMAVAPANSLRLGTPPPPLPLLISRSLRYSAEFIIESVNIRPVPVLVTLLTSFFFFLSFGRYLASEFSRSQKRVILIMLLAIPVLVYISIVASFAPSVYGQGFPLERARFAGTFLFVAGLMIEGAASGFTLSQWKLSDTSKKLLAWISVTSLTVLALYPLRSAWLTLNDLPEYRQRAQAWDERDAYIKELISKGVTELLVPQFDGVYGVKELDVDSRHWTNRCAAVYYNVNSISAIPPDGP